MLTIIAFLIMLIGSVNWLFIGLLQYDFIAGIFGYQASVFSRIIYIIFGIASVFIVFKLFKGKGTLAVFSRRNKKDLAKNIAKMQHKDEEERDFQPSYSSNIESGEEFINGEDFSNRSTSRFEERASHHRIENTPRSLFDEHFDDRSEK